MTVHSASGKLSWKGWPDVLTLTLTARGSEISSMPDSRDAAEWVFRESLGRLRERCLHLRSQQCIEAA